MIRENNSDDLVQCRCRGMNEECSYCGGSGYVKRDGIEIIKTVARDIDMKAEQKELEMYLHENQEKLYTDEKVYPEPIKKKKKKRKQKNSKLLQIDPMNPLKYIGPNNPNRKALGDTRNLGKKGINLKKKGKK